ncbi:MAG: DNA-3-methyladenine glycosylase 2 family protein [Candidatus Delongbacteria bacterium]|nr:DNA-3-methyladenine glycosylase 2 family protein [Candidatus Delongbacteria bacterium]
MTTELTVKTLPQAARWLAERDPLLAALLRDHGVPPLWGRRPGLATLVRIILEQQVSLASARTAYRRLVDDLGRLTPERLLAAGVPHLRQLGLTRQKAAYCVNLASAILEGKLDIAGLKREEDTTVMVKLTSIIGIGPWTAQIYLLMALKRPDVWPRGDLALVTAMRELKLLGENSSPEQCEEVTQAWRPYRAVAARLLWQYYLNRNTADR